MLSNYYQRYAICIECSESIFNPICPICLANEIEAWLKAGNLAEKEKRVLRNALKKVLNANHELEGVSSRCIICGERDDYMCPYCFTEKILDLLKEKGISKKSITKFFEIFNFDFERTGYAREFENEPEQ